MKIKVANYIAKKLVENGITQNFTVTGGGAMHLNDAFGHQKGMHCLYQHHEQACAMAAESYARIYNRPALLCVTSGPGGTNAITGVLGAWLDSIPMIVISGQVRYDNTARWSGVGIRAMGDQEFDIQKSIACMTKYSEMLTDPLRVRYAVEKCIFLAQTGRPGPCWLDIPVDVQGSFVEEDALQGFDAADYLAGGDGWGKNSSADKTYLAADCSAGRDGRSSAYSVSETTAGQRQENQVPGTDASHAASAETCQGAEKRQQSCAHTLPGDAVLSNREQPCPPLGAETVRTILEKIRNARRPVFYTGNGIRIAGAEALFLAVSKRLNIPVVTGWNGEDILPEDSPLYVGRPGGRGDRPGNLAVENADLILSVGSRLSIRQVGYNYKTWAQDAYVIVNDIDAEELKKPSVHCDLPVHADARDLLAALLAELDAQGTERLFAGGSGIKGMNWLETCAWYRKRYPVVQSEYLRELDEPANVYAVVEYLSELAEEGQITVVGNGSACVAGGQAWRVKRDSRFISQSGVASMGYDLPAAIGAWAAAKGPDQPESLANGRRNPYWAGRVEHYPAYEKHDIILLTGDGSLQMNLQELQTIVHHHMPIKIFVINNGGYHSIRQTQNSFFGKPLVGIGVDSGVDGVCDLSFPDLEKLAAAYGYPFVRVDRNAGLKEAFARTLETEGPAICEIMVSLGQEFLPKSSAKRLPDGSLVSPPLEDMAPFLPEAEMEEIMIVKRRKR